MMSTGKSCLGIQTNYFENRHFFLTFSLLFKLKVSIGCMILGSFDNYKASNFIKKESLSQVFCCEFYEICKNTFFHRAPPVAASVLKSFSKFTGKYLCRSLFFNKVAGTGLERIMRTSYFIEHLQTNASVVLTILVALLITLTRILFLLLPLTLLSTFIAATISHGK